MDSITSTEPQSDARSDEDEAASNESGDNDSHGAGGENESHGSLEDGDLFQLLSEVARAQGIPLQWILAQMHGVPIDIQEGPVEYPFDSLPSTLPEVADFIRSDRCKRILVLAGAGMSVVRIMYFYLQSKPLNYPLMPSLPSTCKTEG